MNLRNKPQQSKVSNNNICTEPFWIGFVINFPDGVNGDPAFQRPSTRGYRLCLNALVTNGYFFTCRITPLPEVTSAIGRICTARARSIGLD